MKKQFQSKSVPRGTRTIWRYLGALIILFSLSIGQMWAAEETITWDGTSLAGVSSTNITAGTASAVQGSEGRKVQTIEVYENNSVKYIASGGTTRKKYNDGWWENFYDPACTTSDCTDASTTARIEIPFTIGDSKTFDVTGVSFSFTQNGGSGPAVHAFLVQGTTEVWLGYKLGTGDVSYSPVSPATKLTTLEAGAAKLVFVLGIGANKLGDNRGFLFSNISITGNIENAGGGETIDTEAPTLSSSVPANSATDVAVSGNIVLTMSENVTIADASKFSIAGGAGSLTTASISASGSAVTIPYTGLDNSTEYTLTVAAGAIEDAAATPNANAQFTVSFTTAAPVVEPDYVLNDNNTLNTTDFVTSGTFETEKSWLVGDVTYTSGLKFTNASSSLQFNDAGRFVAYNTKTDATHIDIAVYNTNSSSTKVKVAIIKENADGSLTVVQDAQYDLAARSGSSPNYVYGYWTGSFDLTGRSIMYVYEPSNSGRIRICQMAVYETGANQNVVAPTIGYSVNLNKGRMFAAAATATTFEGVTYHLYSKYQPNNNTSATIRTNGTNYISFEIPSGEARQLQVTASGSYNVSKTLGDASGYISGNQNVNLTEGVWYINPNGSNVTITKLEFATPPTAYAVTYSAGTGSVKDGENMPTQAATFEGGKFTLATGDALEKSGYDFNGWQWTDSESATHDVAAGDEFTMPGYPVTFVAQWTEHVAKYGVKFMDGTTKLDSLSVTLGQAPVFTDPTKALYIFAGWKDGEDNDVTLSDLATSVTVEDTKLVLYAQWAKAYAADGTVNFADDNNSGALADFLPAGYACGNLGSSTWGKENEGDVYFGYKLKNSGAYVELRVVASKRVTFTFGNYAAAGTIKVGDAEAATCALTDSKYVVDTDAEAVIRFTTTSGGTVTLKSIMVGEIPAKSDDATLKDLKVGGVTVGGFNAGTLDYYVELPYGSTSQPVVTATPNDENASGSVMQTIASLEDAVVTVIAEDLTTTKTYTVHFTVAPKFGVELIKATHTGAKTASKAGYWAADATVDKNTQGGSKLGETGHYFGLTLGDTKKFMNGDLVVIYLDPAQAPSAWLQLFKDKGSNIIADVKTGVKKGANYITLAGLPEEGIDALYLYRTEAAGGNMNPYATYIAVYRQMAPFIESFEIEGIDNLEIDQTNKTITASVANSFDVTALTPTVKYWGNGGGSIDKTGPQDFTYPVTYTVSSAYADDATGAYAPVTYTVTITKVVPSVEPTITTQPQGADYIEGASIAALEVEAESTAGTLSYQWQIKNGLAYDDIEGATAVSYTPTVSAIGSYIYRVVVTNTEESKPATSVNSEDATIVIAADPACATFVTIPTAEPYQYTNAGEWTIYNASSSGKRNGSDQIFGDVKDFDGNTVKGFAKERCVLIFEKDMKQIRFYSANAQRAWGETPVRVSDDVETFLGTGTPSYSEYAATTSLIQADPSNNKEQIFIADGEFLAGKCYWFAFSGSLQIFQICAIEADPKAEAPVFSGALSDEAICPGNSFATLDATASPVTSYAWYKDDEVIENAEDATYTPTEAGTYYCIATNSAEGYRDNSTKSAEAVLSVKAATAITTAPANQRGAVDAEVTLSVVAEGANLEYAWYTCDDETGANPVAVESADEASLQVTITAGLQQYYKVVVTGDCGADEAVALVEEWTEVAQADVTESTTWDWTKSCWDGHANVELANTSVEELMANVNSSVVNNNEFRSDMLVVRGQYAWRNESGKKYFQGYCVKFHATVPGLVKVTYRGTGNSKNVILSIGDYTAPEYAGDYTTVQAIVPAGDVVINGIGGEGNENGMVRIKEIVFQAPDYTRPNLNPNNIGTLCWTNDAILGGATLYELAGKNENNYLVFDEVTENRLEAGKPYIFVPENGNTEINLFNTSDEAVNGPVDPHNGMMGTFTILSTIVDGENSPLWNKYIISNNHYVYVDYTNCRLGAYRAYITSLDDVAPANAEPAPSNGAPRRRIVMGGQNQMPTGFDAINASEKPMKIMIDGQIYILRGERVFDATGRLVK